VIDGLMDRRLLVDDLMEPGLLGCRIDSQIFLVAESNLLGRRISKFLEKTG
jgi:hypothetical protein